MEPEVQASPTILGGGSPRHLVLLRLSALGDILRVLPAWTNLHDAFPTARFQAVVEDRHAFLLEPLPGWSR